MKNSFLLYTFKIEIEKVKSKKETKSKSQENIVFKIEWKKGGYIKTKKKKRIEVRSNKEL